MLFTFLTTSENSFEGKKPYEKVLLLLHRHWFVLAIKLFVFLILGTIPLIAALVFNELLVDTVGQIFWLLTAIFYLLLWFGIFYVITMYLLDVWIVTDHRVIDSEQHGFFWRTTAEIHLAKIQDISVAIAGVLPTFLDYGNLEVQSAGASEKFFFKQIPHPNQVRDVIMEAHNQFIKIHPDEVEVHETTRIPS